MHVLMHAAVPMTPDEAEHYAQTLTERAHVLIGDAGRTPANRSALNETVGYLLGHFADVIRRRNAMDEAVVLSSPLAMSVGQNNFTKQQVEYAGSLVFAFDKHLKESLVLRGLSHMRSSDAYHALHPQLAALPKRITQYSTAELVEDSHVSYLRMQYDQLLNNYMGEQQPNYTHQYRMLSARIDNELYNCLADALGASRCDLRQRL